MTVFAALDLADLRDLVVVLCLCSIAFGHISGVRKAQRQIDECHAMMIELVRAARERK